MIYNHPSAYIYTSSRPTSRSSSSSRSTQMQWTPAPHVGASEGPAWSPYLKSPLPINPRSSPDLSDWIGVPTNSYHSHAMNIPYLCTRAAHLENPEQELSSSSTSSSSPLSSCFSAQGHREGERVVTDAYERRTSLDSMAQEPPSPSPSYTKVFASRAMEK